MDKNTKCKITSIALIIIGCLLVYVVPTVGSLIFICGCVLLYLIIKKPHVFKWNKNDAESKYITPQQSENNAAPSAVNPSEIFEPTISEKFKPIKENEPTPAPEKTERQKKIEECRKKVQDDPAEYERLNKLCATIHNEYKELLKEYRKCDIEADEDRMVYILKECWRKLSVINTNITYYNCYNDISIFDEEEKVEKMAKSFINKYVKRERDDYGSYYGIDVMQFDLDLDFINDYIYQIDDKINAME